ncbi:hypothetical protein J2Z32_003244 [Paenibacillus turicensis]|uniref:DUF4179 domain-containing protein n=1 Tax=Paenibacillus turicensis TaxID=160487 RepID=A0ABS4FVH9_9BACL|nr:DUF4179 domain-containing protein [Paenibacillus turicensis]MBP1906582.1 hypothetical protein [Paenibacillus turicensis]
MARHQTKHEAIQKGKQKGQQHTQQLFEQASSDFNSTFPTIPEYKLQAAIKKGIDRGNKQKRFKNGFKKWGLPTGAVVLCALLFTLISLQPSWTKLVNQSAESTSTSSMENIPDYIVAQLNSQALRKAAQNGLYQPINQTSQQDQFSFTVDGVIADGKSATIFYTMNLKPGSPYDSITDLSFLDDNGNPIETFINLSTEILNVGDEYSLHMRNKVTILSKSGELPTNLIMKAFPKFSKLISSKLLTEEERNKVFDIGKEFKVSIPIDKSVYSDLVKYIPINKQEQSANYDFIIEKAILHPMSTELQIKINKPNVDLFHSFILPSLTITDGETYLSTKNISRIGSQAYKKDANTISVYFDSIYYLEHDTITFQADGIRNSFKEQPKLVIDTVNKKLISSTELINLESIKSYKANNTTEIELKIKKHRSEDELLTFISELKDNNGVEYQPTQRHKSLNLSSDDKEFQTLRIELETKKYAQPLTLTVDNLYEEHLQKIDIPLIGIQKK